jgi:hypothetical protein
MPASMPIYALVLKDVYMLLGECSALRGVDDKKGQLIAVNCEGSSVITPPPVSPAG